MLATATLTNDAAVFTGLGVDGLADAAADVGCSVVFDRFATSLGGNTALGLSDMPMGGRGVAVTDVPQTGAAGDAATVPVGAAGIDTLALGQADIAITGCGVASIAAIATELGCGTAWCRDVGSALGLARDLRVSVILHRVEMFFASAPAPIGFPSGHGA